ncbi:hypothetical protein H0E87_009290 [Populus deltoides]|uniref:EF-hand domain-containing protein n=2 Tax=Populus TaxID=3689 RepID=A0A8T2Z3V7_POPDE|nr:hypothetical protein H0E87_009290 [Populus deltoides]
MATDHTLQKSRLYNILFTSYKYGPLPSPISIVTTCRVSPSYLGFELMASRSGIVFEDFFPSMVDKLGAEGFMKELSNGFQLLVDEDKGLITFESLKRNSKLLGFQDMTDDEARCMLREGDLDGDGALNEMEFCTLMFRLSPGLMMNSRKWLVEAIVSEV